MKKNKIQILILTSLFLFSALWSQSNEKEITYISPNNDGIKDELNVPLKISEKRYVSEWALVILDENDNPVRVIGNKEKRPEKITVKSFFQELFSKKEGVVVPESVMWNGVLDSGEVAPDGVYKYYITATDDNGNEGRTPTYTVVVDNTDPVVIITQPSDSSKIFGAGNKTTITIPQEGSVEDLWVGVMSDVNGNIVRQWSWVNSMPATVVWDGKNQNSVAVEEGVYSYSVSATDKAGNVSDEATVSNIIYDAIPRSINLTVKESPFSPNGNGSRDYLTVTPIISNSSGLVNWDLIATDKSGMEVVKWEGTEVPSSFEYDGKNSKGIVLADGDYQLKFRAVFTNGQESIISRNFTVDRTAPSATVRADTLIFSPDGDGNLDVISFIQEASKEKSWVGEIINESGAVVKTYEFGEIPDSLITWDGTDSTGTINDGYYTYRLITTDLAGNTGFASTKQFELNTGTTEVLLGLSDRAFSPNADKVKDTLVFTPQVKTSSAVTSYTLSISNEKGEVVKTYSDNKSLPVSISWNGTGDNGARVQDGTYKAVLETVSRNGSKATVTTPTFVLDTVFPKVEVSTPYLTFSPNDDGKKDTLPITIKSSSENRWQATIASKKGDVVRSFSWNGLAESFEWNGFDESGNVVADDTYKFTIQSTDDAGNKTVAVIENIVVDTRAVKAYLTASEKSFSPNGDKVKDVQLFSITVTPTEGISSWKFEILSKNNTVVRQWSDVDSKNLPASITWDGTNSDGKIVEGSFTAKLTVEYLKGDIVTVSTAPFIASVTPPQLTVRTAPLYFSPDNDGVDDDLYISLKGTDVVPFTSWSFVIYDPQNGKPFWKTSGKTTITERLIWDGRSNSGELVQSAVDYPYIFTVTNELGLTSKVEGIIPVDVLVIRIGDQLKMQVPSIIFRSDAADFIGKDIDPKGGLDQDKIDNNTRVLKRIADILNKFKDYNVVIEGHANNVSGTEDEETVDTTQYGKALVPLSEARAAYVKEQLVKYGVDSNRLTIVGVGGRQPVAGRDDRDNWWKNRRVEFILNK